jgi:type II secretory pathway pseudopilin PulG
MVSKFFKNLKISNSEAGITLIEIVVVLVIIVLFTSIIIVNFPEIQRQLALSKASYQLAQDLRKAEDLGLSGSGIQIKDAYGDQIPVKGFGVYIDPTTTQYIIYADVADVGGSIDQKYCDGDICLPCDQADQRFSRLKKDCIIDTIDLTKINPSLQIRNILGNNGLATSINFTPPGPTVNINPPAVGSEVMITLGLKNEPSSTKTVKVNTAGLISVQ